MIKNHVIFIPHLIIIKILIVYMKYQNSDIFSSNHPQSSIRHQNSSYSSPFQSLYSRKIDQNDLFRIMTFKLGSQFQRELVYNRSNLIIQCTPQFAVVSEDQQFITIKIKEYHSELLPWLITKDALFKVNIVLGIYIAFLELIDVYGLFPLHPNMMRVNEKQQVAVWINTKFEAFLPDQVLKKNSFSMMQFMKSFLRIFKCCLPSKKMSQMYTDTKQLLNQLVRLKRKQQIHKNCHEFIKHDTNINTSRKSKKCVPNFIIQKVKVKEKQRQSTKNFSILKNSQNKQHIRLSSFSPPKRSQMYKSSLEKIHMTTGYKLKNNAIQKNYNSIKKRIQQSQKQSIKNNSETNTIKVRPKTSIYEAERQKIDLAQEGIQSICSTGQLFKRYLMYNTSKYHKNIKTFDENFPSTPKHFDGSQKIICRSDVYFIKQNSYKAPIVQQRGSMQVMSQKALLSIQDSPIKFRKMSSNTNERQKPGQNEKKFVNSKNCKKHMKQNQNFTLIKQNQSDFILSQERKSKDNVFQGQRTDETLKCESKQMLKSSFPYKTSSTLTSFRLSNQHQYQICPSKSEQNLISSSSGQINVPLSMKEKDKKIQQMKIVQENELENDFNNIFSMQNSDIRREEDQKKLEWIISEFQQVLF